MPMRWCRYDYYYSRKHRACLPCPVIRCPPGDGLNNNCGYSEFGYRVKTTCSRCKEGFYSPGFKKDIFSNLRATFCKKCGSCLPPQTIDRSCTRFHDVQCSPCPIGNIPSGPSYGVYISQLIRYARCCSHYDDFRYRHKCLVDRLLSQGYKALRLEKSFKKFYCRYQDLIEKYRRMYHFAGQCYNCTYCCDDLLGNQGIKVPQCLKAGMGRRCSCPTFISCTDKRNNTCPIPMLSMKTREHEKSLVIRKQSEVTEARKKTDSSKFLLSLKKLKKAVKTL